jgi:hypothetical protein
MKAAPGTSHADVSLRCLTWPHIPRKFTRPSHVESVIAPNRLFCSSGNAARVGSIPIARSTLRQRQATQGYRIGINTLIRWESLGNIRRSGAFPISWAIPALPQHSHVQSHVAVPKSNLCDCLERERSHVAGLDLEDPVTQCPK